MEKLYLNDSYIKNFKTDILYLTEDDSGNTSAVLDSTAFYPEGGGQPSDTGFIGDSKVTYVYEKEGIIYHVIDKKPTGMKSIECSIDWDRRFDHMQQHCGQHILSASFDKILGGKTVGFHLGSEYVTVDIDLESLSGQDIDRVESMSNDIVFQNLPIRYHYPDKDELSKFDLRKQPVVEENIRIVEIDGFDFSPCGGTHPSHTGDVGIIKIRKWEKYKNTCRVEFVCGWRAFRDYAWKNRTVNEASLLLSSKDTELLDTIKKAVADSHANNKELKLLKERVLSYEAAELYNSGDELSGVRVVKKLFENRDFKEITALASKISKFDSAIALLGLKSEKAQLVFTRSNNVNIKINELFKEVLPLIEGKGGGSPQSAQGGGSDVSNLESALDGAYLILKNRYIR